MDNAIVIMQDVDDWRKMSPYVSTVTTDFVACAQSTVNGDIKESSDEFKDVL